MLNLYQENFDAIFESLMDDILFDEVNISIFIIE